MLDSKALVDSAYYDEMRRPIRFVSKLMDLRFDLRIGGQKYLCVPSVPTIARRLDIEEREVRAIMSDLMQRKWARKYRQGDRVAYALGTPRFTFMQMEITSLFHKARRTKKGAVYQTEWRWLRVDNWTGTTVWAYIEERLKSQGIPVGWARARGRKQMQTLIAQHGVRNVKETAEFFVRNYPALRDHFKWTGFATPGLFCGFYGSISQMRTKGIPSKAQHDRSFSKEADTQEWGYL